MEEPELEILRHLFVTTLCGNLTLCLFEMTVGLLSIDMTLLAAFYFLQKKVPARRVSVCIEMSRNLTPIYVAQWCVIGFVDSIFCYLLEWVIPYWAEYLFGVALIFISYWLAKGWRKLRRKFPLRARQPEKKA